MRIRLKRRRTKTKNRYIPSCSGLSTCDDPDGVDDAGKIAQKRQQDVDPELRADAYLQEYAERRQNDGQYDAEYVHSSVFALFLILKLVG